MNLNIKIPEAHLEDLENHLNNLKKARCLELSKSPFNSPIFLVKKKDGSPRIVLDYRLLNSHTMPDKCDFLTRNHEIRNY